MEPSRALLIVDIQNDYFPGGRMELEGSDAAAVRAAGLLAAFRERRWPVFHVQHVSMRPGSTYFLAGTDGVEIHPSVAPERDEPVVEKHFPNSFRETRLGELLRERGVEELVIAGMMTHMCIDATTRAACDLGFTCFVAHDACATRSLAFGDVRVPAAHVHCSFLSALNGTYATVLAAAELAKAL
jgi:nicotinamidase-related amidase